MVLNTLGSLTFLVGIELVLMLFMVSMDTELALLVIRIDPPSVETVSPLGKFGDDAMLSLCSRRNRFDRMIITNGRYRLAMRACWD